MNDDALHEAAKNLLEQAREVDDPKLKQKLLDGAKRINSWRFEGVPERYR